MKPIKQRVLWFAAGALPLALFGQNAPAVIPVPHDPLELAAAPVQRNLAPAGRDAALQLLARARNSYLLKKSHAPWELKVRFIVDSRGQTDHDGSWEMDDVFAPGQGVHWTAKSSTGYSITGIFGINSVYAEATASIVPLRLQEARAVLFNPIASVSFAGGGSIRTVISAYRGSAVTCILMSRARSVNAATRSWEETEDCIDPQSGLLRIHSDAPGRYVAYDYTNAPRLGEHGLPRTVTITEAGRVVSTISVESLQTIASFDPALFAPSERMKAEPATAMVSATKLSRAQGQGPVSASTKIRPVCIFGLVTPSGQLVEAHSLQPDDPNSEAALRDAKAIDFSPSMPAGGSPRQHFVFLIEKFVTPE